MQRRGDRVNTMTNVVFLRYANDKAHVDERDAVVLAIPPAMPILFLVVCATAVQRLSSSVLAIYGALPRGAAVKLDQD